MKTPWQLRNLLEKKKKLSMEYESKFSGPSSHADPQLLTGRDSEEGEWPQKTEKQLKKRKSFPCAWLLETVFHVAQVSLELPMWLI